jgi:hypothetical protein
VNRYIQIEEHLIADDNKDKRDKKRGDDGIAEYFVSFCLIEVSGKTGVEREDTQDIEGKKERNKRLQEIFPHAA